jgi:hypothetical protein
LAQAQAPARTFRQVATRHRTTSYTYAFQRGLPIYIPLNRQGYLAELRIKLEGTMTVGTAGTVTDPYATINFFPSIGLRSPQGDYLISVSSRSLWTQNFRYRDNTYDTLPFGIALAGVQRPDAATWNPGSATAQPIDISYIIPIAMNLGQNFDTGLLLTQIANNDFILQLNCASNTDLVGSGSAVITSITGSIYIEAVWFELVDPTQAQVPDIHTVCRLRDSNYSNLVTGDNYISYQLGPVLMDEALTIYTNVTPDTTNGVNFPYIKKLANRQIELENRRGKDIYRDQFLDFGKQLPNGVFWLNFFDDYSVVNVTRARDFINSNLAAQLDTVVNIATGTTLSASQVVSIYRELVTLGA